MAKKVSGWSVGRGSSLSAVSRGGGGGATFFGLGAAAAWSGAGTAAAGGALGAESVPAVGDVAPCGMNGLTRPCVGAGGLAGLDGGADAVVAAG